MFVSLDQQAYLIAFEPCKTFKECLRMASLSAIGFSCHKSFCKRPKLQPGLQGRRGIKKEGKKGYCVVSGEQNGKARLNNEPETTERGPCRALRDPFST